MSRLQRRKYKFQQHMVVGHQLQALATLHMGRTVLYQQIPSETEGETSTNSL
jgi:hypothetical protein